MKLDFNNKGLDMNTVNSARRVSELAEKERLIQRNMVSISRQHAINEKTKVEAAEVTIEQFMMFKQELIENKNQSKRAMIIAIIGVAIGFATFVVSLLSLVCN